MRQHLAGPRLLGALALCAVLLPSMAAAQSIATDGTVGLAKTLTGPKYAIGASLGKVVGANLFQSFLKFGLLSGESANFTALPGIADIIARVTGGSPSSIDGAITSSVSLFLINPFGIVFGPHAIVGVAGSFHAATADYVKLADGSIFSASHPEGSTFSTAPPAAFGFLNASPPAIMVEGSTIGTQGALSLVGGPVTITGGTLSAPGGTIHIASAAGPGEIPVDPVHGPPATVTSYGPVGITQYSYLTVASGGSVFIRAGTLTVDASEIDADNNGASPGGEILLQADGQITISSRSSVRASATGNGPGADIVVDAGSLTLSHRGVISAGTFRAANAGNVLIEAGTISLSTDAVISSSTGGKGAGGNLVIDVSGDVSVRSGAVIIAIACRGTCATPFDTGNAGNVVVNVGGTLSVENAAIAADTLGSEGNGGDVTVTAGALNLVGNAGISADTANGSTGRGGNVSVTVAGQLTIDGGIISAVTNGIGTTGDAGSVVVTAGSATILDGGAIVTATILQSDGNAGVITVDVADALTIDGSKIDSESLQSNGNAGLITVAAGRLSILDGGAVSSSTSGASHGGDIKITAGNIVLSGPGPQITAQSLGVGSGNAGSIEISAGTLQILDGASISTAGATANGGNITISVGDLLYLRSGGITTSSEGVASNGGKITIDPPLVVLANGSVIDADAFGGNGGNITILARAFIASSDSLVTASSQKGISGTITISGQLVGLNGALVVLPSALRGAEAILKSSCAARRALPRSSFVAGGRGGLPQDPETVLPALYLAPRAAANGFGAPAPAVPAPPRHTAVRLEMRCG